MTGKITSYSEQKKYGFIAGDNGKDYFVHLSAFKGADERGICEGKLVKFDEKPTPKGMSAANCVLQDDSVVRTFALPDTMITTKGGGGDFKGYTLLKDSNWNITGSSRHGIDDAKNVMINLAAEAGANALYGLQFHKTTESEPGTGRGVHYYTMNHVSGVPCIVGKPSLSGTVRVEDLDDIDYILQEAANRHFYINMTLHVMLAACIAFTFYFFVSLLGKNSNGWMWVFALIISLGEIGVHNALLAGKWLTKIDPDR